MPEKIYFITGKVSQDLILQSWLYLS